MRVEQMSTMTLAELKLRGQLSFPETLNTYYQSLLDAAEEMCLQECGIASGTVTEYFNGGVRAFALNYGPVSSVTSVEIDGTTLQSSDYRLDSRAAKLTISAGTSVGVDNVKVVYTCAFTETELFKQAIAMTVQQMAKLQSSKQVGVVSRTTDGGTEQLDQKMLPEAVKTALNKFKRGFAL